MSEKFFNRLSKIDEMIKKEPNLNNYNQNIKPYLIEDASRNYFYEQLKDPKWINIIKKAGNFNKVPKPKIDSKTGTTLFPYWPESYFLSQMALKEPNKVIKIILKIPETKNIQIHEDFIGAALNMPPNLAVRIIPKAKKWISFPYPSTLPQRLGNLISYLAKGNQIEEALELARAVLKIMPDKNIKEKLDDDKKFKLPPEPEAQFDIWFYEQIMENNFPDLLKIAEEDALMLLCDLLEDINKYSQYGSENRDVIWRPAIEDNEQNHPHGLKDSIITAIRDSSNYLIEKKGEKTLKLIERRSLKIFKRIGIYLHTKMPDLDPSGNERIILDRTIFDDLYMYHEYYHLLKTIFKDLPIKVQQTYLKMVNDASEYKKELNSWKNKNGKYLSKNEKEEYLRHWQYRKLYPIQEYLDLDWNKRFNKLEQKFKELEYPDFHSYMRPTMMGPISPKKVEDLSKMNVEEIISFLKTWRPQKDPTGPSPEGLGRELRKLIKNKPNVFSSRALEFKNLDPTYVRSLLIGLIEAIREDREIKWNPILKLCKWILEQPRELPNKKSNFLGLDPDWNWTRKSIADLLSNGFESKTVTIPFKYRKEAWEIIEPLAEDPEPDLEYEKQHGGSNMDPATISINTVRGEAMHAVLKYGLWVRRNLESLPDGKKLLKRGFKEMPEVKEVLEYHLDINNEPTLSIRSIYGRWLPKLELLDSKWIGNNLTKIFPVNKKYQKLRDTVWGTYVSYNYPYFNIFNLLKKEYYHAVKTIIKPTTVKIQLANPKEKLVEHIMALYWNGKLKLGEENGLLDLLFKNAPDEIRRHALWFIGKNLKKITDEIETEILNRLKLLWEYRIQIIEQDEVENNREELSAFGMWFISARFDDDWSFAQLKKVLTVSGKIFPDLLVIERLVNLVNYRPVDSVECLKLIIEGDKEGYKIYGWKEQARTILKIAMESTEEDAKQIAEDIINRLGAKGHLEFRDLLTQNNN